MIDPWRAPALAGLYWLLLVGSPLGAQPAPSKRVKSAGWVFRRDVDPLNDSATVSAHVDARESVSTMFAPERPRLEVSCNLQNGSRVLNVGFYTGAPSNHEAIKLRFDQDTAMTVATVPSSSYRWQYINSVFRDEIQSVVRRISSASGLIVRFTPFVQSSVVFSFAIAGGDQVVKAMEKAGCSASKTVDELTPEAGADPDNTDQPYFEFQVEKHTQQIPGTVNLHYPNMFRSREVEGKVLGEFVVDADGRYEAGTFKELKSNHFLFTQAVEDALHTMRFHPTEVGGKKVKQLLQQSFTFPPSKE